MSYWASFAFVKVIKRHALLATDIEQAASLLPSHQLVGYSVQTPLRLTVINPVLKTITSNVSSVPSSRTNPVFVTSLTPFQLSSTFGLCRQA